MNGASIPRRFRLPAQKAAKRRGLRRASPCWCGPHPGRRLRSTRSVCAKRKRTRPTRLRPRQPPPRRRLGRSRRREGAAMTPDVRSEEHADSGFVLVAVLWILAALATLASIYSVYAVNTVNASHVADDRVQTEASIRAGVEMAVFQELAVPEPARPSHGAFDLRVGRTSVAVSFRSEAARIDLNAAPADLLAGLFAAVGVDSEHAGAFADRVVGWRTTPSNADPNAPSKADANAPSKEAQLYAAQGVRYPPRQAPFD